MFGIRGKSALAEARKVLARAEVAVGVRSRFEIADGAAAAGLMSLLPAGLTGSVVSVVGAAAITHTLTAHAMGDGGWAAMVGVRDMGWLAAHEAGVDLNRVIAVPTPGAAVADAVAACIDGCDVVVLGRGIDVGAGARRSLMGRVRAQGSTLITAEIWPGTPVLRARVSGGVGAASGTGFVSSRTVIVERDGMPGRVIVDMGSRAHARQGGRHLQAVS